MGFDNECILNIQSLAGEYFCPVCRLLVYPNEAIQSQCTHLYCKPCLTYVVSTTRACPYDGYLVTEADSKPLVESNKALAETIDKIEVHCLYHRSGCTWQGPLSECTSHCAECAFGNSPVVCNRCGTQIVHRQVQEHAQNCPGVQPQAQQIEVAQDAISTSGAATATATEQTQAGAPAGAPVSQAQTGQSSQANVAPMSGQDQNQAGANVQSQAVSQAMPTPEQWYQQQQQQYQQYYQQYPGYDTYQQHYQHYDPNQQQAHQQYQQQYSQARPPHIPGQHPPQVYMLPQVQSQSQLQPQAQPPMQPHAQLQPQPQPHAQSQPHAQAQALVAVQPQMQGQANSQQQLQQAAQPPPQGHQHPQSYSQAQPHPQQHLVQPHPQMQHTQPHHPPQPQPQPQSHLHPHSQPHAPQPQLQPHMVPQSQTQPQPQPHPHPQPQPQPQPQLQPQLQTQPHLQTQPQHPSAHPVTGHQSYPQHPHQQLLPGPPQHPAYMHPQQQSVPHQPQHSVQMQSQFPHQQPPQMRPPQSQGPVQQQPQQQQPAMLPQQSQHPNIPPVQQPHASQPLHQHPGIHPPQQKPPVLQQQVQQFHQQHLHSSQPFPAGQTPGLVHNQAHQQGLFIQQQQQQQQQPAQSHVRPLGPPSLQQHAYGNPQLQHNVPLGHGLQPQPLQNLSGRPMMPNHVVPQQPFPQSPGRPAGIGYVKPMQPGPNQPAQNQNYPSRTSIRPQSSLEQQLGYIQQPALSQSGSQNALFPALLAAQSATNIPAASARDASKPISLEKPSDSKPEKCANELENDTASLRTSGNEGNGSITASSQDTDSSELKVPKCESDSQSVVDEEKRVDQDKNSYSDLPINEILCSSQALEKDPKSKAQGDGSKVPVIKQMAKEEATENLPEPSLGGAKSHEDAHSDSKENSPLETKGILDAPQKEMTEGHDVNKPKSAPDEGGGAESFPMGERAKLQILSHHGYQDRNLPQAHFPQPSPSPRPMHYGAPPPHQKRPPAPDQMFQSSMPPPQMHVPGQLPAQMRPPGYNSHLHLPQQGQPSIPTEHFQQPMVKQPHGTFHAEVVPGGVLGPGSSASFGRGPAHLGPPQKGLEPQSMVPQGYHNQGVVPPPHAGGPRITPGESMRAPPLGGPPPGAFESHGSRMARGPPHGIEGQMGQPCPPNPIGTEMLVNDRPGYIESRQPVEHIPFGQASILSNKMKMNGVQGKGGTAGGQDPLFPHGLQEDRFKSLPDERYRQLPQGGGFNQLSEERFKHFPMEPGRHMINRRELEEDLKQFPRPTHLDEPGPKFENHFSSRPHGFGMDAAPRPLDRAPAFGRDAGSNLDVGAASSRLLPPYQPGGSGERARPAGVHDDNIGRKVDPAGAHTEFLRPISEFGRHRMDGMGPPRSPGREYPSRFGSISAGFPLGTQSRLENMDDRESRVFGERSKPFNLPSDSVGSGFHDGKFPMLPGHMRRGDSDGHGNLRIGELIGSGALPVHLRSSDLVGSDLLPGHLRNREPFGPGSLSHLMGGESLSTRNFPGHMKMGEPAGFGAFPSHLRINDLSGPGNLPSHLRIGESIRGRLGEPGFGGSFPTPGFPNDGGFFPGDMESFDHSRKRKPGSMGWCRICKIDCETVEGLDLHSQTREHQKMAMDMVLSIKHDNAKKQKLASDDHTVEEASKSRKANFESRGNRH